MKNTVKCTVCGSMTLPCACVTFDMLPVDQIQILPLQPTLHDLAELVDNVAKINDKEFTRQVTIALQRINHPICGAQQR